MSYQLIKPFHGLARPPGCLSNKLQERRLNVLKNPATPSRALTYASCVALSSAASGFFPAPGIHPDATTADPVALLRSRRMIWNIDHIRLGDKKSRRSPGRLSSRTIPQLIKIAQVHRHVAARSATRP